jgi:dolichol-phosphate mannosyltransferase
MTPATGTSGLSKNGDVGPREHRASFAVVIPMFNEEAGVEGCVASVCAVLQTISNRTGLIAVNDGSRDRTGELLANLHRRQPLLDVVAHDRNLGYGAALGSGIRRAAERDFEYVLFMDSDLTNDPVDIPRFASLMETGIDVIKASRYSAGGGMRGVPWSRATISRVGNAVARALFRVPVRDCTNGFRAVGTSLLSKMQLRERGFPIIVEELYWCRFLARSYGEVPVVLTARPPGSKPTSFAYRPAVFWRYLWYGLLAFAGIAPRGLAAAGDSRQAT